MGLVGVERMASMVAWTEWRVVGQVVIEWRASVVAGTEWRVVGQVVIECWALGRAVTVERVEWWAVRVTVWRAGQFGRSS